MSEEEHEKVRGVVVVRRIAVSDVRSYVCECAFNLFEERRGQQLAAC